MPTRSSAILYGHPIPENSFAVRDLQHKLPGVGLFDLRRTDDRRPRLHLLRRLRQEVPRAVHRRAPDRSRTHGKGKERHFAGTITVDERRCVSCSHCMETCKFDALIPTELYTEHRRRVQELANKPPQLTSGHGLCSGCGAGLVVNQVLGQVKSHYVVSGATGCLEVEHHDATRTPPGRAATSTPTSRTRPPRSAASRPSFRALYKRRASCKDKRSSSSPSAATAAPTTSASRPSPAPWSAATRCCTSATTTVCYMNTGFQRSSATPQGRLDHHQPGGHEIPGKLGHSKNLTEIMVAHRLPYVAQSSPHDPQDLMHKASPRR